MNKYLLLNKLLTAAAAAVTAAFMFCPPSFAYSTDFIVNSVEFIGLDGKAVTSLDDLSQGIEISADITNISGSEKNAMMLAGVYDSENGGLKTLKICNIETYSEQDNTARLSFAADELSEAGVNSSDSINIYFLEENMLPVQEKVVFPYETSIYDRRISEFTACNGNQYDMSLGGNMTWNRIDFAWQSVQPTEDGGFSEAQLKNWGDRILQCQANGITMLPILDYTANWAADPAPYEYTYGGTTYSYGEAQEIEGDSTWWNRERTLTKSDGTVTTATVKLRKSRERFKDVRLWEEYVEKIVSTYSAQPYNLEYFQIWNEAHPGSGFWNGGMDYYMTVLHKTAADIIHKYGCKVVYGGWPDCGGITQYCDLLDTYDAWKDIDIFDLHYYNVDNMYTVYKRALKAGVKSPKVWATEVGWISNVGWVCGFYPRLTYMALMNRSEQPDQFKAFFFTWGAPAVSSDSWRVMTNISGSTVTATHHARNMKMLMDTCKGNNIERYTHITTSTGLKYAMTGNSLQAFEIDGKKIVANIAAGVTESTPIESIIADATVSCEGVYGTKSVQLADYEGSEYHNLDFTDDGKGNISFTVPEEYLRTSEYNGATSIYCYLIINAVKVIAPENNVKDFEWGSDSVNNKSIIAQGRWSYVDCHYASPRALQKGTGAGKFTTDEWTVDNNKTPKAWCVSSSGTIYTDTRHIGYNYTIDDSMSGRKLLIKGTFKPNSKSRTIKIYKTSDNDDNVISSEKELIFEYTGKETKEFSIEIDSAETGNDILFEMYSTTASDYTTSFSLNADISLA